MYCPTCTACFNQIFDHDDDNTSSIKSNYQRGEYTHHQYYADLVASARNGCIPCRDLVGKDAALLDPDHEPLEYDPPCTKFRHETAEYGDMRELTISYNKNWLLRYLAKDKEHCQELTKREVRYVASEVIPNKTKKWQGHFNDRSLSYLGDDSENVEISDCTGSATTMNWVKGWLQNCRTVHTICTERGLGTWLPTRLLYVGTDVDSIELRLCDTSNDAKVLSATVEEVAYTTLSHRWGSPEETPTLTRENRTRLSEGVDITILPLVFQQAIRLTRTIGVHYIWIDSLCIVQDDLDDWASQGASMSKIYRGSSLNISSESRTGDQSGLFINRDPERVKPFLVRNTSKQAEKYGMTQTWAITPKSFWTAAIDAAPLNARAWVLQERVLSPRVVHFTQTQVLWECLCQRACETFPGGIASGLCGMNTMGGEGNLRSFFSEMGQIPQMDPEDYWTLIVEAFTVCGLTKREDKLIALAWIANELAPKLKQEYIAGMWKATLVTSLLWHVEEGGYRTEDVEFVAPSWSWASVEGPVSFPSNFMTEDHNGRGVVTSLLESKVMPRATGSPYGQIASASITLRCALTPMRWTSGHGRDGNVYFTRGGRTFKLSLKGDSIGDDVYYDHVLRLDGPIGNIDKQAKGLEHHAFFFGIYLDPSAFTNTKLKGLVLDRLANGCFARMGMIEFEKVWSPKLVKGIKQEDIVLV